MKKVLIFCLLLLVSSLAFSQTPIDLKLPFKYNATWIMTHGYFNPSIPPDQETHKYYQSSDERYALDFAKNCDTTTYGQPVLAAAAGTIQIVSETNNKTWGVNLWINHPGGCRTRYAHMIVGSLFVKDGDYVKQGQIIGLTGNTGDAKSVNCSGPYAGAHIHFVLQCPENGQYVGKKPEPMSGYSNFTNQSTYISNNGSVIGYWADTSDWKTDGSSEAFYRAYIRNSRAHFGLPTSDSGNPNGVYVHKWDNTSIPNLYVQNFDDSDFEKRGVILWTTGSANAYAVRGGFWNMYRYNNGPVTYGAPVSDEGCWYNNGIVSALENKMYPAAQLFKKGDGSLGLLIWNTSWPAGDTVRFFSNVPSANYTIGQCANSNTQSVAPSIFIAGFSMTNPQVNLNLKDASTLGYDQLQITKNGSPIGSGFAPNTQSVTDTAVTLNDSYQYQLQGTVGQHTVNVSDPITFTIGKDYTADYFNNNSLSGTPAVTQHVPKVDFNWDTGSPAAGINPDNFSARFTGSRFFAEGNYTLTISCDDGCRLFIDDQLIINAWWDHVVQDFTATKYLTEGDHALRVEYYERGGGAIMHFNYTYLGTEGWLSNYWNTPTAGSSPAIPTTTPNLTRLDNSIDFNWGGGSPDPTITNDKFVMESTRTRYFTAGIYRFMTTSDDGVRLYVDGIPLVLKWFDQGETNSSSAMQITEGLHTVKVQYYENTGSAVARVSWTPYSEIGSYTGQYFSNKTLSGSPVLTRNDSTINFDWGQGSPDPSLPVDNFSARWTKTLFFDAGTYQFTVTADDGVRLYLDDELVIDKWVDQGSPTYAVNRTFASGNHTIRMEYYENTGGAVAKFSWKALN